jgi:hypothetical protein
MTGVAVLVTGPSELVTVLTTGVIVLMTGASASAVAVETEDAALVTSERGWVAVLTTGLTVSVMGAAARVGVDITGATVPVAATGDAVLATVTVTAFVAIARVCGAAGGLSALATGASTPVVLAASEAGAWATVAPGAFPEVAVEVAEVTGDAMAAGTAGVAEAELTAPGAGLVEPLPGAAVPEPVAEGLGAAVTLEVADEAAELTAEVTAERGGVSGVAACACRENTSMITKIPAATIASCTARRAMRRRIGCGMSSSPPPGRGIRAPVTGGLEPRAPKPRCSPNLTCCSVSTVQCDNLSEQETHGQ